MTRRIHVSSENYYLWMVSGGICSFEGCNERLVMETDGALTNQGIQAHIIGHAAGSARHEFASEFGELMGFGSDLEDVKNMMLMCYPHSKLIDDVHTRHQYPPEVLFEMKRKHEAWVNSWTEQKDSSIAIIHKKMGPPMTTIGKGEAPTILLDAVEDQTPFTDFTAEGWMNSKQETEGLYNRFVEKIIERKADVAEVYPLSPIPLLIFLGSKLTDTVPTTTYQYDRDERIWVSKKPNTVVVEDLDIEANVVQDRNNELVVTISVSGIVDYNEVNKVILPPYDRLDIMIKDPGVTRVKYSEQVHEIQNVFRDSVLKMIRGVKYKRIHLFYAGPAGLAVEIGKCINSKMWPGVSLYHYEYRKDSCYQYTFDV